MSSACFAALPTALAPGMWRWLTGCATLVLLALLTWADNIYWRIFEGLLPLQGTAAIGSLWDVRASIVSLVSGTDALLLPLPVVAILAWRYRPRQFPSRRAGVAFSAIATLLCVLGTAPMREDVDAWLEHRYSWKLFSWVDSVRTTGLLGAHARDAARTWREASLRGNLSAEELTELSDYLQRRPAPPQDDHFGAASGLNVLLVQVEAMQQWAVGARVLGQPVMPTLAGLEQESVSFTNIWDQTGASPTADCEYLVLNSQHPLARGAVAFRRQNNRFVTLPSLLKEHGYTTLSAHAFRPGFWNRGVLHTRYGFDRSLFRDELGEHPKIGWGLADERFFERVVPYLEKLQQPWMGFLITLTSHHPFNRLRRTERRIDVGGLLHTPLGDYVQAMNYVDDALALLFERLDLAGLRDNTLVVIYGDHDSKLKWGPRQAELANEVLGLSPVQVESLRKRGWLTKKVPVIFVYPTSRPASISTVGGQIDLAPSVLHHLGLPPAPAFMGQALTGQPGAVVRFSGAAVSPDVLTKGRGRRPWCYDHQWQPIDDQRCTPLRAFAEEQLRLSWRITDHDLARELQAELTVTR